MKLRTIDNPKISVAAIMFLALCGILLTHCKKFEVSQEIIIRTEGVSEVTLHSCRAAGMLVDVGSTGVSQHGFCWSLTPNHAGAIDKPLGSTNNKGGFSTPIEGFSPGTEFHIWAFAENEDGRKYGEPITFTTLSADLPTVETGGIMNVTPTTAQCEYNVLSDGGSPVHERGLCWGTTPAPTIDGAHTTEGPGTGNFIGTMGELTPVTDYFVRPFAINEVGIAYGDQRTFGTPPELAAPIVHTESVANVTHNSAVVVGSVSFGGGAEVVDKGFCWSTDPNPTVDDNVHAVGAVVDPFEWTIEDLAPNTHYFVRAFADNLFDIGYGDPLEFKTLSEPLVDERPGGKVYPTVQIGELVWMAQNLDYGVMINGVDPATEDDEIQKYCYEDDPANCEKYGGLYTWLEMMQYNPDDPHGVCPDGWHIPSDEEWKILEMHLGMSEDTVNLEDWRGTDEGGKLKVPGYEFWDGPNEGATNESGFSALPGGGIDNAGLFGGIGFFAHYWTSSWIEPNPWYRYLNADRADIRRIRGVVGYGTAVRCVKD